jgi:hypothetical protein
MTISVSGPRVVVRRVLAVALAAALTSCGDGPSGPRSKASYVRIDVPAANAVVTCTATAPGASSCAGLTVGMAPYAAADHFNADFQSNPGSGQSSPITITFSRNVTSVTVTAEDPTVPVGNQMQVFSAAGVLLGTVPIPGNGLAGTNVPRTVSIGAVGIRSVVLTPPTGDYVAYSDLSFTALDTCTVFPTTPTDTLLTNPDIQEVFRTLAEQTHWNLPFGQQTEVGGFIARDTAGGLRFFPYNQPAAIPPGPCLSGYTLQLTLADIPNAGFTIVGQVHTHPQVPTGRELNPGNCYNWNGTNVVPRPDSILLLPPGPSVPDLAPWQAGQPNPGYPGYVIGPRRIDRWEQVGGQLVPPTTIVTNACVATGG